LEADSTDRTTWHQRFLEVDQTGPRMQRRTRLPRMMQEAMSTDQMTRHLQKILVAE
jgi:hypothetical protein